MDIINLTVIEKSNVMELEVVEKYNPYHDPKTGRFTTSGGAGGGASSYSGATGAWHGGSKSGMAGVSSTEGKGGAYSGSGDKKQPAKTGKAAFDKMSDKEKMALLKQAMDKNNEVPKELNTKSLTQRLMYHAGMNDKPDVLSDKDYDSFKSKYPEQYKGTLGDGVSKSGREINEDVRTGKLTRVDTGKEGDGLYFTKDKKEALRRTEGETEKDVMRAKIKPDAKVISFRELQNMLDSEADTKGTVTNALKEYGFKNAGGSAGSVYGVLALMKGYDAIYLDNRNYGEGGEMVVLNRGCMVVPSKNTFVAKGMGETVKKSDAMETDVVEKYNPYHDPKTGRFTSASGAGGSASGYSGANSAWHGGSKAGMTGVTSAEGNGRYTSAEEKRKKELAPNGTGVTKVDMNDIKGGPTAHSLAKYVDANGNLAPEREKLHEEIVLRRLEGIEKAQGQQEFIMMGGGPASGKSTVVKQGKVSIPDEKHAVTIDPDWCKAQLPEYQEMVKKGDPRAASFCHEESSALAKRISTAAQKNGYNVVYDGTGDGSKRSVEKKVEEAKANGLVTKAIYVTCPTDVAVTRSDNRGKKTGRVVPEATIRETHKKVSQILPEVAHLFDGGVQLFDTNGEVKLIAEGGKGKGLTALDEKLFNAFLAKANE